MTVIMTAGWRKAALTTHVTASVGWLGSVAAFLALAIVEHVSSGRSWPTAGHRGTPFGFVQLPSDAVRRHAPRLVDRERGRHLIGIAALIALILFLHLFGIGLHGH
jgi:hypothetical protein